MNGCALVFNEASGGLGGIIFRGGAAKGGAIYDLGYLQGYEAGVIRLINCTFAHNRANGGIGDGNGQGLGGAMISGGSSSDRFSLQNVTIAHNFASGGLSAYPGDKPASQGSSIWGPATLTNTILLCEPGQTNATGTLADGGHNISSDASANFASPSSRNNLDPLLGSLADNGGPTPTMALWPGSPAINAGDDSAAPATDQRGVSRPQGGASDIGAFELAPVLNLTRRAADLVTLEYAFLPGQTNRVGVSTNLIDWQWLGTGEADGSGKWQFQDTTAKQFQLRFYRVD
jgi:hypothetical protein